jgi:hypothetical protein
VAGRLVECTPAFPGADDAKQILASLQTGNAELVQRAEPPTSPSSPQPIRNAVLGAGLGLFLGIAMALGLARLDRRLRDADALRSDSMDLRDTAEEAAFRAELRAWLEENLPEELQGHRGGAARFDGAEMREWSGGLADDDLDVVPTRLAGAGTAAMVVLTHDCQDDEICGSFKAPFAAVGAAAGGLTGLIVGGLVGRSIRREQWTRVALPDRVGFTPDRSGLALRLTLRF